MFVLLLNNYTWCKCFTREEATARKKYLESQGFSVLIVEGPFYK